MFRNVHEGQPVIPRGLFLDIFLHLLATSSRIKSEAHQTESEQRTSLLVSEIHFDLELRSLFTKPITSWSFAPEAFAPEVASPRVTTLTGVCSEPEP
jgi:hypothetical protein